VWLGVAAAGKCGTMLTCMTTAVSRPRAWLTREDGATEDVSDRLVNTGFLDSWQQSPETPQEFTASGWQQSDDTHSPGAGRPGYRVVYKTLRVLPFPGLTMVWENLRLTLANGDVERGGMRVPTGIPGRNARHVVIPEHGRVLEASGAPSYLFCPDLIMGVAGWEETVCAVSYLELLYVPDTAPPPANEDAIAPTYEELLARGRAGIAALKTLLDLAMGPRLLAMPLTEEVGETFDDWHWNRRLNTGLFTAESQAQVRHVQAQETADLLGPLIERHQDLDPELRRRLTLASQWYWRADADTDAATRFIAWWLVVESLEMVKTTDIRPVRERLGELTDTASDDWRQPIGRLFGLRSKLVHGEADIAPEKPAALVELVAKALLNARLLGRVPTTLQIDLLAASGLGERK